MSSKVALHPQRGCSNCFVAGCGWVKAVYWILLTKCRVHLRAAIISLIELHNDQCTDVTDDALKSLYIIVVNLYIYTQCAAAVKLVSQKLEQLKKHIFTTKLLDIFHFS